MKNTLFANATTNPVIVLLIIIGIAAVIALAAYIVYKLLHPKLKKDIEVDEDTALREELDRVLEPVEDEDIKKQIEDYKEDDETN